MATTDEIATTKRQDHATLPPFPHSVVRNWTARPVHTFAGFLLHYHDKAYAIKGWNEAYAEQTKGSTVAQREDGNNRLADVNNKRRRIILRSQRKRERREVTKKGKKTYVRNYSKFAILEVSSEGR
ncbi:hypothetical protein BTUL_0030g00160 [Botrytis tulipae]|uniref:Uncharacterized protein n=1 Tax=Botrytis tulipae TaxID=87230 RepID=A0A4Z1EZL8_9HELO|nr:hypothetical protein BTUL_0030g00160 [Botrytis tulipae]